MPVGWRSCAERRAERRAREAEPGRVAATSARRVERTVGVGVLLRSVRQSCSTTGTRKRRRVHAQLEDALERLARPLAVTAIAAVAQVDERADERPEQLRQDGPEELLRARRHGADVHLAVHAEHAGHDPAHDVLPARAARRLVHLVVRAQLYDPRLLGCAGALGGRGRGLVADAPAADDGGELREGFGVADAEERGRGRRGGVGASVWAG